MLPHTQIHLSIIGRENQKELDEEKFQESNTDSFHPECCQWATVLNREVGDFQK